MFRIRRVPATPALSQEQLQRLIWDDLVAYL